MAARHRNQDRLEEGLIEASLLLDQVGGARSYDQRHHALEALENQLFQLYCLLTDREANDQARQRFDRRRRIWPTVQELRQRMEEDARWRIETGNDIKYSR